MGTHTPGPWEVRRTTSERDILPGTSHYVAVITRANNLDGLEHLKMLNGDYHVCKFNPTKRSEAADMMERDARLIAAAPELLEAAKCALGMLTGNLDGDWSLGDPVEMLRSAIAAALSSEGGEK